jgi:transcriptional regulator with XRE-family HTH domain
MPQNEARTIRQKITGVLLRQARVDAGKTLKECGQVLSISSSALSAVEHGRRPISLPELELLAYYLGVPVDQLLNGGAEPTRLPVEKIHSEQLLALRHRVIGALLRRNRLEMDLSQAELAKSIGVSKRRVSQYEMGERAIPLVELEAIAQTLNLSMADFLDEGVGPVGEQQRLEREYQQFAKLPSDVRAFVLEPASTGYLELAMSLSEVSADDLRNIAASLLEITL